MPKNASSQLVKLMSMYTLTLSLKFADHFCPAKVNASIACWDMPEAGLKTKVIPLAPGDEPRARIAAINMALLPRIMALRQ